MRSPQAELTLTKGQNKTREPLTESQTRLTHFLTHTRTESYTRTKKYKEHGRAAQTLRHMHLDAYTRCLKHRCLHTHIHSLLTKKLQQSSARARARTHGLTGDRMTVLQASPPQPKPQNLSPIIWPVLGAAGNPELPLSSGADAGISAISPSLENKSLLVLPPSPCFQGSWG